MRGHGSRQRLLSGANVCEGSPGHQGIRQRPQPRSATGHGSLRVSRMGCAHRVSAMSTSMVDWTLALTTAQRLVKPGPEISPRGAAEAVAALRQAAGRAEAYVTSVTGLEVPSATTPV